MKAVRLVDIGLPLQDQARIDLSHLIAASIALDAVAVHQTRDALGPFKGQVRTVINP